jgi:N-sulfoglucosamine sulfohydrolase
MSRFHGILSSRRLTRLGRLAAVCLLTPVMHGAPAVRPNIVVCIADDLGWEESSPYGNPAVSTPHLQRIAREGMRFDRFMLTASSCSPSRSSMFSGRYPHNTGAMNLHTDMKPSVELFIEPLRATGYHTMLIGKSHGTNHPEVVKKFDRMEKADWGRPWTMGDMWERALRERPPDRPFLLWAASIDPHRPYRQGTHAQPHDPAKVVVPPYLPDTPEIRSDLADYYDEIARFDEHVGRLLRVLSEQGVLDQTVVLVISDNGRAYPHSKTRVNLPGIKSPLLVRYPKLVPAGSVAPGLVSAVDLAPTILELANARPLAKTDGTSFVPILRDPAQRIRTAAFAEHNWHNYMAFERAVITETHVYVRNWLPELPASPPGEVVPLPFYQEMRRSFEAGTLPAAFADTFLKPRPPEELFDTARDPHCQHNLATDPFSSPVRQELERELLAWQERTGDAFPSRAQLKPDDIDRRTGTPLRKDSGGKRSTPEKN